jgi:DNA polymerase-3 subunit alpha
MVLLINDCKRMKITVGLPDINKCYSDFTIDASAERKILFGLSAVKNVGRSAVDNIVKERSEHGPYESFVDFCSRVDTKIVTKKTVEGLIFAGAFDSLDPNRRKLFDYYEPVMLRYGTRRVETHGQSSLFGGAKEKTVIRDVILEPLKNHPDWTDREKLSHEKAVLGLYLSSHPLSGYEDEMNKLATLRFGDVTDFDNEEVDTSKLQRVRMCGIITDFKVRQSKRGNRFATFRLEDFTGSGECVVFPKTYEDYREILRDDAIVTVVGRAEENGNAIKVIADEIKPLFKSSNQQAFVPKVTITVNSKDITPEKLMEIKKLLNSEGGRTSVYINLKNGSKSSLMELQNYKIHYDEHAEQILTEIFGKENIILN